MSTDDAVGLLTKLAGPGVIEDAGAELCQELGCLPLAVEQVGAYLAEAGITAREYLAGWYSAQAQAAALAPEPRPADRTMTGVWRITLENLADTLLAGKLLRVAVWPAPDGIARVLLAPAARSPQDLTEALRRLNALSLVGLHSDGTVSVHRVVQAVSRISDPAPARA